MTNDQKVLLLKNMLRIRRMEEVCAELYTQQKIRGFLHLYIGEEAVATGVMSKVREQDNVVATYREHGHALLKGVSMRAIMAEMFGRVDGCSRGHGGSMHLFSREHRFFGGNAIVGGGLAHAVGIAFAAVRLNEDRRTFCFLGDGATAEGIFHESMNLAALWRCPVIWCCENNLYAMGTALARYQSQTDLSKKAESYNVFAMSCDGMNVEDVCEKTEKAISYVKEEKRPVFIEFKTYRFRPHSMFDPDLYRTKEEIEGWKKRCPINLYQEKLLKDGNSTDVQIAAIGKQVEEELQDAINFAESSPLERIEDLEKYLLKEPQ